MDNWAAYIAASYQPESGEPIDSSDAIRMLETIAVFLDSVDPQGPNKTRAGFRARLRWEAWRQYTCAYHPGHLGWTPPVSLLRCKCRRLLAARSQRVHCGWKMANENYPSVSSAVPARMTLDEVYRDLTRHFMSREVFSEFSRQKAGPAGTSGKSSR